LILAAIISAVCITTFVLIPVALFIITIAIIEGTDAIESTKRSFDFIVKNLGEVIVFIIIVIIVWVVLSIGFAIIPFVGAYIGAVISWLLNVVLTVASVHFYLSLRTPPPPPPPPPPA
jgi:F0F1-type ATP synthase assembly protein I